MSNAKKLTMTEISFYSSNISNCQYERLFVEDALSFNHVQSHIRQLD